MDDFTYDVVQKAKTARSARKRKSGSKSKYVSLPHDHLSTAELKRRNGEVQTYNLGKPMAWKEFKAMPDDLKKQYLCKLQREYGATQRAVASMLGINFSYLCRSTKHLGVTWRTGAKMSDALAENWKRFCSGGDIDPAPPCGAGYPGAERAADRGKERKRRRNYLRVGQLHRFHRRSHAQDVRSAG